MADVLSAVNERRLRPIYEQLDNGNNKKALQEADKVLKKQKDLTAAKVLKTIALHRLGKNKEAFSLSQEIIALEPTDENSLQGLSLYFKEIRKTEHICTLYEAAVKHCPGNEEYLTHLFMSYVRHEKFREMQKIAMNLYKHHPKNPYFFWGIMAIVLQARYTQDRKLATTMYMPLALKMIEKHIDKGKIEAEAEVRLYLLILEFSEMHEKIIEVLNNPMGDKLVSELRGRATAKLNAQRSCNRWHDVNKEYKKLLKENPDVWNYALGYLDSFFTLYKNNSASESSQLKEDEEHGEIRSIDQSDYLLSHAFQFIQELIKAEDAVIENKKRGPYLLRLEMLKRVIEMEDISHEASRLGSPWKVLLEYALDFSTKPCCFHDLAIYFSILPEKDIDKFLADLYEQQASFTYSEINGETSDPSLTRKFNRRKEQELHRHIFTIEATRFLGKHESLFNEEKFALASDYMRRHKDGIRYSDDRPPTDPRVADAYCLFAVRLLLDVYQDTEDVGLLWRCASVLEYGLSHSSHNFEFKFMLIHIYCKLGLFKPCRKLYDSLQIKYVQHETLGYTVSSHVVALAHYDVASLVFQLSKSFHLSNDKECVECLISCFRNGTFYKVIELVDFRKLTGHSFHAAFVEVELSLMELFVQADIKSTSPLSCFFPVSKPTRIDYESLTDNRDLSLITDINPENKRLTKAMIDESFAEQKKWLLFRELLLRCLQSLLSFTNGESPVQNECVTEQDALSEFDQLLAEFENFCEGRVGEIPSYPFHGPRVSRLHLCVEAQYPLSMAFLLKYCRSLCSNVGSDPSQHTDFTHYLTSVISNISDFLKTCSDGVLVEPKPDDSSIIEEKSATILSDPIPDVLLSLQPGVIERLAICVEMFSLTVLAIINLSSVISFVKSEMNRKRRKKKNKQPADTQQQQEQLGWVTGFVEAIASLNDLGVRLSTAVGRLKDDSSALLQESVERRETSASGDQSSEPNTIGSNPNDKNSESGIPEGEEQVNENMEKLTLSEEISSPHNKVDPMMNSHFEQITRSAAESVFTSYDEMRSIIDGRLNNIKCICDQAWFPAIRKQIN